jgi:hypothetical protein
MSTAPIRNLIRNVKATPQAQRGDNTLGRARSNIPVETQAAVVAQRPRLYGYVQSQSQRTSPAASNGAVAGVDLLYWLDTPEAGLSATASGEFNPTATDFASVLSQQALAAQKAKANAQDGTKARTNDRKLNVSAASSVDDPTNTDRQAREAVMDENALQDLLNAALGLNPLLTPMAPLTAWQTIYNGVPPWQVQPQPPPLSPPVVGAMPQVYIEAVEQLQQLIRKSVYDHGSMQVVVSADTSLVLHFRQQRMRAHFVTQDPAVASQLQSQLFQFKAQASANDWPVDGVSHSWVDAKKQQGRQHGSSQQSSDYTS